MTPLDALHAEFVARAEAQCAAATDPAVRAAFAWCIQHHAMLLHQYRGHPDDMLNGRQAAAYTGFSTNYLARLCRSGMFPNYGRPNRPRYRRGDLPCKGLQRSLHLLTPEGV